MPSVSNENQPFHSFGARSISGSGYPSCGSPDPCRFVSSMVGFVRRNVWPGKETSKTPEIIIPFRTVLYPTKRAFPSQPYQYLIPTRLCIDRPRQHLASILAFSPRRRKKSLSHMYKQLQTPAPFHRIQPTKKTHPADRRQCNASPYPANRSPSRTFPISDKSKTDRPPGPSAIVVNTVVESYYTLAEGQSSSPVAVRTLHLWL